MNAPLVVGQSITEVVVEDLTRTRIVQYAGASGDFNPLHTDEVFAVQVSGAPSVFAHGMLTMAMAGRAITDLIGPENLLTFGGRFTARVWPGDRLIALLTLTSVEDLPDGQIVRLEVRVQNQQNEDVFVGYASGRNPVDSRFGRD